MKVCRKCGLELSVSEFYDELPWCIEAYAAFEVYPRLAWIVTFLDSVTKEPLPGIDSVMGIEIAKADGPLDAIQQACALYRDKQERLRFPLARSLAKPETEGQQGSASEGVGRDEASEKAPAEDANQSKSNDRPDSTT